jgi:hypothetical protein
VLSLGNGAADMPITFSNVCSRGIADIERVLQCGGDVNGGGAL